jgi:energy-coupling factor transport system ATP-binding protein
MLLLRIRNLPNRSPNRRHGERLLEIRVEELEYVYNPGTPLEIKALGGVDFTVGTGKFLGILGGTGSGKTTLIRNLNGLLTPTRGRVLLDGTDSRSFGPSLRKKVGVVFQRPERQLFEDTVFKDISFVLRRFSGLSSEAIQERVRTAVAALGLDINELGDRSPLALSEGQKRKVAIAGILVNEPEALILDEPAVGLDPPSIEDLVAILEQMKESGDKTVIIVSHDMDPFLHLLDLLMVMRKGNSLAFGTPDDVCRSLAKDPAAWSLLPELALLVHDLRDAGYDLPANEFRIPILVEKLAGSATESGGPF